MDVIRGNPAGIRDLARHWTQQADAAESAAGTLASAKDNIEGGTLRLKGDFAPKIKDAIGDLPGELRKLAQGYRGCGRALDTFATKLTDAQQKSRRAQNDWDTASRTKRSAEYDLDQLAPGWDAHAQSPTGLRAYLADKPEPVMSAVSRRESADRDVDLATTLSRQAAALRGDAERDCVHEIQDALEGSGLKNRTWYQKVGDYLKESFTTWDGFVKFCESVSLVLGVIALFLTGPIALIVGAVLLVAAAVAIADKLMKLARGEIGWGELAFELGMVVLARFGGRALGPAFRRLANTKAIKAFSKQVHKAGDRLADRLKLGDRARNLAHRGICTVTGHPIDVATGKLFTAVVDLDLPGPLPFAFERVWYSTSTYTGPLGHGWHHSYDAALYATGDALLYRTPDGRVVDLMPLYPDTHYYDRQERLTLSRDESGYRIRDRDGLTWCFAPAPAAGPLEAGTDESAPVVHRLQDLVDRAGHRISLTYDEQGRLQEIVDSGGREVGFEHDEHGRIVALTAPHPTIVGERVTVATYGYDEAANLVTVTDALGQDLTYTYAGHLMTGERDRGGLGFFFEYDSTNERARCTHTWGEGSIYERHIRYEPGVSVVADSLAQETRYEHEGGLMTATVDALGARTRTEYEYQQPVQEIDALGRVSTVEYDWRGNPVRTIAPDGAVVAITVDEHDQPVQVIDPLGGAWTWTYDAAGLLRERRDPEGRISGFDYRDGLLSTLVDGNGGLSHLSYDEQQSLVGVRTPDGATYAWQRDRLGRVVQAVDPLGNVQQRRLDPLGRVAQVDEADGTVRRMTFDGQGNLITYTDQDTAIEFRYQGVGQIAARSQGGTRIQFTYDTEERVVGVVNEHDQVCSFTYGPTGQLATERDFGGSLLIHERDLLGRPVTQRRASGAISRFSYDAGDRVIEVTHTDGSAQRYAYRADGALMRAENDAGVLQFERNLLGEVVRESFGEHGVSSDYDGLGRRVRLRTTWGLDQQIERTGVGDVAAVTADGFTARFTRDGLGQETARELPGGVQVRWHRDQHGRANRHEVLAPAGTVRDTTYGWGTDDRLEQISNAGSGSVRYERDGLGQLIAAAPENGPLELRMADTAGNLFRTPDGRDRTYAPGGQLQESTGPDGRRWVHRYDADGNLISRQDGDGAGWSYRWNADGSLAAVTGPDGHTVRYAYDALGRRVSKTTDEHTTSWIWDGHVPVHEWDSERDADVLTWLFEPESFTPLARLSRHTRDSIVTDHLGTALAMLDQDGDLTWNAAVSIWGELDLQVGARGDCPFRWPGQYEDAETGLSYNRFRYYDPQAGQYLSKDPIGLLGGLHPYAYVADPLTQFDPWGLTAEELAANLTKAGRPLTAGQTAHHIVKENATGTFPSKSRDLLEGKVDINAPENGARLWGTHPKQEAQPMHPGKTVAKATGDRHGGVHIHGKQNDRLIYRILKTADKKGIPLGGVLEDIGRRMESGDWKRTATGGCYGGK